MRLRRAVLLVTAAAVGLAPVAFALEGDAVTGTGFSPVIVLNDDQGRTTGGAEPSIEVDSHGSVYVSAPVGVPTGGCPFWEVLPDSGEVSYRGTIDTDRFSVGGGDCDISLTDNPDPAATHDVASITSLSLANLTSNKTSDGGETFETIANPAAQQVFGVDRQWQAADRSLDRHYLTVHDLATVNIQTAVSTDGGYTYVSNRPVIDPTETPQALATGVAVRGFTGGNSFGTTVVDESTHKIYVPFAAPQGDTFDYNTIYVAEGDPCAVLPCVKGQPAGPITWTTHEVHVEERPDGDSDLGTGFPAIAIDRAGTVYVGWTGDPSSEDTNGVFVSRMAQPRDASVWTDPVRVDDGSAHANLFPWLVAGTDGRAGIAWYSATNGGSCAGNKGPTDDVNDDCTNDWTVQYAATDDRGAAWDVSQVSPRVIHEGAICTGGLSCPDGTRTLLDFFDVAVDAQGRPNFAYNDDERAPGTPDIHYTRQCAGTSLTGVPLVTEEGCRITSGGGSGGGGGTASPTPTAPPTAPPTAASCVTTWTDAEGDASTGQLDAPGTQDPNLDLVRASVSSTARELVVTLEAAALNEFNSDLGDEFGLGLLVDGRPVEIYADRTITGVFDGAGVVGGGEAADASVQYDLAASTVTLTVPAASLATTTGFAEDALLGKPLTGLTAFTRNTVEPFPVLTYDEAATDESTTYAATCAAPTATATPTGTSTPTPTPTPTATVDPEPTLTADPGPTGSVEPTPTCSPRAGGRPGGEGGKPERCKAPKR